MVKITGTVKYKLNSEEHDDDLAELDFQYVEGHEQAQGASRCYEAEIYGEDGEPCAKLFVWEYPEGALEDTDHKPLDESFELISFDPNIEFDNPDM